MRMFVAGWLVVGSMCAAAGPLSGGAGAATAVPIEHAGMAVSQGQGAGAPVGCGKVDSPNGPVDLVAVPTKAGTVGCTEAINVISEYFVQAPTRSQGTAHALTVAGWNCLADTGARGTGAVGCDKDGLAFHTQP